MPDFMTTMLDITAKNQAMTTELSRNYRAQTRINIGLGAGLIFCAYELVRLIITNSDQNERIKQLERELSNVKNTLSEITEPDDMK